MRQKGFTLIELLTVIIIISIIAIIIFPAIGSSITQSRKDLYQKQIDSIQKSAQSFITEHKELIDKYHTNDIYISIKDLINASYIEGEVINPMDKTKMNGCVRINYDVNDKNYTYIYEEQKCEKYAENHDDIGYIIYTYDKENKTFVKSDSSNEIKPIGQLIYEAYEGVLKVDGEVDTGLYDGKDYYYFKGANPNNYLTIEGDDTNSSWRILSINKNDFSLKLISASPLASNTWNNENNIEFNASNISNVLLGKVDNDIAYNFPKIVNNDYETGVVLNESYSVDALRSSLSKKMDTKKENSVVTATSNTSSLKVGSLSVLDYVNASSSKECVLDYLSDKCKENNYLKEMFGTSNTIWTINNDGTKIWYLDNGTLSLSEPNVTKQIYSVVTLMPNAISTNKNATGTENNPYKIK